MSKHTPGWNGETWKVDHEDAGITRVVFDVQGSELQYLVADFYGAPADRLRHARFVAAAPELLEALKGLYADQVDYLTINKLGGMDNHWMKAARAAIARAEGK